VRLLPEGIVVEERVHVDEQVVDALNALLQSGVESVLLGVAPQEVRVHLQGARGLHVRALGGLQLDEATGVHGLVQVEDKGLPAAIGPSLGLGSLGELHDDWQRRRSRHKHVEYGARISQAPVLPHMMKVTLKSS